MPRYCFIRPPLETKKPQPHWRLRRHRLQARPPEAAGIARLARKIRGFWQRRRTDAARPSAESGADGDRTHDLSAASAALSQLSYGPAEAESTRDARASRSDDLALGHLAPQLLEAVERARLGREHVHDAVDVVEQDPVALAPALAALRQQALVVLELELDLLGDRLHVARVLPVQITN